MQFEVRALDPQRRVVASTQSSGDGYYLFTAVRGGEYLLRISPEQLRELGVSDPGLRTIRVRPDGHVVAGADFVLVRTAAPVPAPASPAVRPESATRSQP